MVVSGYAMKKVSGDTKVYRDEGVDGTGIYIGSLDCLEKSDVLWKSVGEGINEFKVLTLYEIASQLRDARLITVITDSPFSGKIYQYGNYSDGEWWEIGSTGGYA